MRHIWKVLLFLIPALIIIAIALVAFLRTAPAQRYVGSTARTQIQQALKRPTTVGRTEVTRTRITLHQVEVRDRQGGPVLARVPRVVIHYSLPAAVLRPSQVARAIRAVEVYRPELYLRRSRQGVWNVADLLRRPPTAPTRLAARVLVIGGVVEVTDEAPPKGLPAPQVNRLAEVDATAFIRPTGMVVVSARAVGTRGRVGVLRLAGTTGGGQPALLSASARGVSLPYAWRYLQPGSTVQTYTGTGDLQVTLLTRAGGPLLVVGGSVQQASFRLPQFARPLEGVTGRLAGTRRGLGLLGVRSAVGGTPLLARGLVVDFTRPRAALTTSSARLSPAVLAALIPGGLPSAVKLGSPVSAITHVWGAADSLQLAGRAQAARVAVAGVPLRNVDTDFTYAAGELYLGGLQAGLGSGMGVGQAWVAFPRGEPAAVAFIGRVAGAPATALPRSIVPAGLSGTASGPVVIAYRQQPEVAASLQVRRGQVAGVPYDRGYVTLGYQAGVVSLAYAHLAGSRGEAAASGTISREGQLDLSVAAAQVSLADLARRLGQRRVRGLGFASGHLGGTTAEPDFTGQAQAVSVAVGGRPITLATAGLQVSRRQVTVENGIAFYQGAEITAQGQVGLAETAGGPTSLDLQVAVRRASMGNLLELANVAAPVEGSVEARAQVAGNVESPRVTGSVQVFAPLVAGQPFDEGTAQFAYTDDRLTIESARLTLDGSSLTAQGTVGPDQAIYITLGSENLQLAQLVVPALRELALNLTGPLAVSGRISGTTSEPLATVALRSPAVEVDGQRLTDLAADLRWQEGVLSVESAVVHHGSATYTASGTINTEDDRLALRLQADDISLQAWRQLIEERRNQFAEGSLMRKFATQLAKVPRPLTGEADAVVTVAGPAAAPSAEITFEVPNATMAGAALPTVQGRVAATKEAVTIQELVARQGDSYATITGRVEIAGPLELDVDAFNINARLLEPWIKLPVQGSADLAAVVGGTVSAPQVVGSAQISDIQGSGISIDSARVTRFALSASELTLEEVVLVRGDHRAVAAATLPVSISPFEVVRDRPLSITVDLANQDLTLLAGLVPGVTTASGPLNGRLAVSGTADQPQFDGSLTITGGEMAIRGLGRPVTGLNVNVVVAGQTLIISQFQAAVGAGRITAQGTAELTALDPRELGRNRYAITLTARDIPLSVPRVLEGVANADLQVGNRATDGQALITGQVAARDVTMAVPPAGVEAGVSLPQVGIGLDVTLTAQRNVWLRTTAANIQLTGSGHLGGTISAPTATATLDSRRGTLIFPGARFQLTYAVVDIYVPPPAPAPAGPGMVFMPRVNLQAEGQAQVAGYRVFLTMSGPMDNLQPRLRSIPELPQSELYALVVGVGRTQVAFQEEAQQVLTAGLTTLLARPLEEALASGLGLAELSVEFPYAEPVRIRVGQYLFPQLYLTYLRSITGPLPTWTLRATYEVTPSLSVGASVNQEQEQRIEVQGILRF